MRNILLFGLAFLLIFAPVARGAVRIWSISIVLLVETFLVFLWLWRANNADTYSFKRTKLDYPILLFAIIAVISFIFSVYRHDSFYALVRLFGYIGIYYLVVNEFDHDLRKKLVWFIIFTGTAISAYGILQYFGTLNREWWFPQGFLASTYVNHNHFAGYLELIIPFTIGFILKINWRNTDAGKKGAGLWNIALLPALVIMMMAFVLTQSRGAWLALFASFFVISVVYINTIRTNKKAVIVLILIVIIAVSFFYFGKEVVSERMDLITGARAPNTSTQTRLLIWRGTIDLITNSPLIGCGIGDYIWAFTRFRPEGLDVTANSAHNDYLEMAAEMGIAAPVIFILMIAIIITSVIKNSRVDPLRVGCVAGILSLSLHGLVDFNFHIPANMLLFTVYAAIIMSTSREHKEER
ncbi:MAG: O-antigen ligase family protein [Candidatus Omnitrophota bacterium]|jgi:O-antigen ligase